VRVLPPQRVPMGDSITMARLFARNNIATPKTWVFAGSQQMQLVAGELPFPCLFRVRRNTGGRRVFVAEHTGEAMQLADNLGANGYPFLVQEIVAPPGKDIRAFVVGSKVVAAIERMAPPGYVWPREDGNARATPTEVTPEEEKLAVAAAKVYNAPYAAVSMVRRPGHQPLLLELSRAPTLTEVERVTGVNVAGAIIDYCKVIAEGGAA
jgi:ribosomal protein S6--L-glutamate ligase